ncbi:MAG: DUF922 domain-containing protein [Pseudomonadota bacterium]
MRFFIGLAACLIAKAYAAPEVTVNQTTAKVYYTLNSTSVEDAKRDLFTADKPIPAEFTGQTAYEVTGATFRRGNRYLAEDGSIVVPLTTVSLDISYEITMPRFSNPVVAKCFEKWLDQLFQHEEIHIQVTVDAGLLYFRRNPNLTIDSVAWTTAADDNARRALEEEAFREAVNAAYDDMVRATDQLDEVTEHGEHAAAYLPDDDCGLFCYAQFETVGMAFSTRFATFSEFATPEGPFTQVLYGDGLRREEAFGTVGWQGSKSAAPTTIRNTCNATASMSANEGRDSFVFNLPLCPPNKPPWKKMPNPRTGFPGIRCPAVPGPATLSVKLDKHGFVVGIMEGYGILLNGDPSQCARHRPFTLRFRAAHQPGFGQLFSEGEVPGDERPEGFEDMLGMSGGLGQSTTCNFEDAN